MGKRGGGGGQASNAKELKMFIKNRMWRDHWHALVAVVAIVVACFGASVYQFSTAQDHIFRVDVADAPLLARVFQSGEPWVVLCAKPDDLMPEVFSKAASRLAGKSFAGVVDCTQTLPTSRKTVLARFGLKTSISPTVFTVANGEKPKQVFLNYLQTSKALAKRVVEVTKKTASEVLNSAQLDAKCLQKPACVLLLRGAKWSPYEKQWLDRLMDEHRKVPFAWLDASVAKLSIEASLPKLKAGEHRLVLFKKHRDDATQKPIVTAKAFRNAFELLAVRQFLEETLPAELTPLAKAPTVLRRKKATPPNKQPRAAVEDEAPRESYADRRRRERREADKGDDYYFAQPARDDEDEDAPVTASGNTEDDEVDEVIDLDE